MSKHTPGPWHAERIDAEEWTISVPHELRGPLAAVYGRANVEADAKLIAAAPEQQAKIDALTEVVGSLLACIEGAMRAGVLDPRNGNTADNGVDEGDALWNRLLDAGRAALRAAGRIP